MKSTSKLKIPHLFLRVGLLNHSWGGSNPGTGEPVGTVRSGSSTRCRWEVDELHVGSVGEVLEK